MSLVAAIQNALRQKSTSARDKYLQAIKAGKAADVIATLAREAGLSDAEILAHADVLEQAAELGEKVKRLPAAEEAAKDAKKRLDDANAKLEKVIRPLEEECNACACEADVAALNLQNLKPSLTQLHSLYQSHPELLPIGSAPEPLRKQVAAAAQENAASGTLRKKLDRFAAADQRRDRGREILDRIANRVWPHDNHGVLQAEHAEEVQRLEGIYDKRLKEDGYRAVAEKFLAAAEQERAAAVADLPDTEQLKIPV